MRYADLVPGTDYGTASYAITAEEIAEWRQALGPLDCSPGCPGPPDDASIAPPALALVWFLKAYEGTFPDRPRGSIHARQELRFGVPARLGEVVRTRVVLREKYLKRDRKYAVFEMTSTNPEGQVVVTGQWTSIWAL